MLLRECRDERWIYIDGRAGQGGGNGERCFVRNMCMAMVFFLSGVLNVNKLIDFGVMVVDWLMRTEREHKSSAAKSCV